MKGGTSDQIRLRDILREVKRIQFLTIEMSLNQFSSDWVIRYALICCLEIIGEAANHISKKFQAEHGAIEWSNIINMRTTLIFQYDEFELHDLWNIIQHLPSILIPQIEALIEPDIDDQQ